MLLNILWCVATAPYREPSAPNVTNAEDEQFWFKERGNKITHFCLYLKRSPGLRICQWIWGRTYIVQGRWNILSVIFLLLPIYPSIPLFLPLRTSCCLGKHPQFQTCQSFRAEAQLASCRCTNQHILPFWVIPALLLPLPLELPSGQQQQVPEEMGEQEGPLAMLWESRVPSPSQRASLFKFGPAWLDPIFWEGDVRAGIFDCNLRHMGSPYRRGESIGRQNLNSETGCGALFPGRLFQPEGMVTARALRWQ